MRLREGSAFSRTVGNEKLQKTVSERTAKQLTSGTRHGDFNFALRLCASVLQAARLTKKAMRRTGPKSVACDRIRQLGEPGGPSSTTGRWPARRRPAAEDKKEPTSYLQSSFANASSAASAVLKSASDAA